MLRNLLLASVTTIFLFNAAARASASQDDAAVRAADAKHEQAWAYSVGVQNYVFGLPLVIFERERKLRLNPGQGAGSQGEQLVALTTLGPVPHQLPYLFADARSAGHQDARQISTADRQLALSFTPSASPSRPGRRSKRSRLKATGIVSGHRLPYCPDLRANVLSCRVTCPNS